MMSWSASRTATFTKTDVRYVVSKIRTDLEQMRLFYGSPSSAQIERYGTEAEMLLAASYLKEITYGFRRGTDHVPPTLKYTQRSLLAMDDRPGRVPPGENVAGATFYTFLSYTDSWFNLTQKQRDDFEATLPFIRGVADKPGVGGGIWVNEKSYSSNGQGVYRTVLTSK
jgi:hypothetical protein